MGRKKKLNDSFIGGKVLGKDIDIEYKTESLSCCEIVRLVNKNKLSAKSAYQRNEGIWSKAQKDRFIDSLARGLIIPPIYARQLSIEGNGKGKLIKIREVVDGQQRIHVTWSFFSNKHRIPDSLTVGESAIFPEECRNCTFEKLPQEVQEHFNSVLLQFVTITSLDDAKDPYAHLVIATIYQRLNSTGSLKNTEKVYSHVNSAIRNVAVNYAEPFKFNEENGIGFITNENYHSFFKIIPYSNVRKQYVTMLISLFILFDESSPNDMNLNHITSYINNYPTDGNTLLDTKSNGVDVAKKKFVRETINVLDLMYEAFRGSCIDEDSDRKDDKVDYLSKLPLIKAFSIFIKHCSEEYEWDAKLRENLRKFCEEMHELFYCRYSNKDKENFGVPRSKLEICQKYHANRHETSSELVARVEILKDEFSNFIRNNKVRLNRPKQQFNEA